MLRWPRYGLKAQSKTGRCSGFNPLGTVWPPSVDVFNGVEFLDVRDDALGFLGAVAQPAQRFGHRAVDDLQQAAARQQLVLHQRDVGLDAGRVAVHQEGDGAGGRQHGDLRVAIARCAAAFERAVPGTCAPLLSDN